MTKKELNYVKSLFPDFVSDKKIMEVIIEWTAFPMCGIRIMLKQLSRFVRATNNGYQLCWGCGEWIHHHKFFCDKDHHISSGNWN